jgi:transcriptional regulator with XRE-family HTH domain
MPDGTRGSKKTAEDLAFNTVVGRNIKYLRKARKLNQTKVAEHCKVKFQQLQKYEKGLNGCSAFRLQQLAKFFKVSMEVLVDPNMITQHRGFTGQNDWLDELEFHREAQDASDKQALSEEIQKEMTATGQRLTEVISKCP